MRVAFGLLDLHAVVMFGSASVGVAEKLGDHLLPSAKGLVEEWRKKRLNELKRAWLDAAELRQPAKIKPLE